MLGEVKDEIEVFENLLQSLGLPAEFSGPGMAMEAGGGVAFNFGSGFSMGAEGSYQTSSLNNRAESFDGTLSDIRDFDVVDISGVLQYEVPKAKGLYFGVSAGVANGSYEQRSRIRVTTDPASNLEITTAADGSGPSIGLYAGYRTDRGKGTYLLIQAGIRYRKIDEMSGTARSPQLGYAEGVLLNSDGDPLGFDFSGIYLRIGLGYAAGVAEKDPSS
jgi:hypothetical protein